MSTRYILRFDDIAPGMAWSKFLPFKEKLERLGVKSILGVVPDCRDPGLICEPERSDFYDWVRKWASYGDMIAQHGTFHVYDSKNAGELGINKRSEFAGHPMAQQMERLTHGKSILEKEGVWQPYFMAPAHSFDETTLDALADLGFYAVTDGYGFYPYRLRKMVLVPQLTSFPLDVGFGFCTVCLHINNMTLDQIERLVRFVTARREKFICFEDLVKLTPETVRPSHAILRKISSLILRSKRAMHKLS